MVSPPGSILNADDLREAIAENRDGAGYMIRSNGRLLIDRSYKDDVELVERLIVLQAAHRNDWIVFHARLATHGSCTDDNCHPFVVPGTTWALAHNGICGLKDGPFSDRSDSRILAEDHIPQRTWEQLRDGMADIEKWLGTDKVVILSSRKERGGPCLIFNHARGVTNKDGTWYSHGLYWPKYRTHRAVEDSWDNWEHGTYTKQPDGSYRFTDKRSSATATVTKEDTTTGKDDDKSQSWSCLGCGKDEDGCTCEQSADEPTLIERAAILLNVSPDDLRAWGYDDPVLLQEITSGWEDTPDGSAWGRDPVLPPWSPAQMIAAGWSARGYWDHSCLWHEPNGDGSWSTWEPDEAAARLRLLDAEPFDDMTKEERDRRVNELFFSF